MSESHENINKPWERDMKAGRIPIAKIEADPENPRRLFNDADIKALADNMKIYGQSVPVIVYPVGDLYRLADGERRWRGVKLNGGEDILGVILPQKPDEATLRIMQLSLEAHKISLSPMERSDLLAGIKQETGWSVTELADRLQMSQPIVSKLLAFQKLIEGIQNLLHTGAIDMEKAYAISGEPDPARQLFLVDASAVLSRDQVRARVRQKDSVQPKAKRAVFALPGGMNIALQGVELTLDDAIEWTKRLMKELKRGLAQGLDITTQQRVMRDKAK